MQLAHFMVLVIVNAVTWFALTMMLVRSIWALIFNITTIEEWEIERHETLLRRSKATGGYLDGPDGIKVKIKSQEFPFDIGIWGNLKQGMGTWNVRDEIFFWEELLTWPDTGLVFPILSNPQPGERVEL